MDVLKFVENKCNETGVELLYLCKFGSHLYGTNTEDSDEDYKGIFLPSIDQCILGKAPKNINWSSGNGGSRNTNEDIDVSLWSLQYFMKLVSQGETNALDLLYSYTYPEMIVYSDDLLFRLFKDYHHDFFNIKDCKSFVGYAIGQAKKYGIKGSRLGVIKKVFEYVENLLRDSDVMQLSSIKLDKFIPGIIDSCYDSSFCFEKEIGGINSLVICGKVHQDNISMAEFIDRITREYKRYGDRAKLAEQNEGIDWKAISHAVRALDQMQELIDTGMIKYPLRSAPDILKVKKGEYDFNMISEYIVETIDRIDTTLNDESFVGFHKLNSRKIEDIILYYYQTHREPSSFRLEI